MRSRASHERQGRVAGSRARPRAEYGAPRRALGPVAALGGVVGAALLVGLPAPSSAQRCGRLEGQQAQTFRQIWGERTAFRDTVRRILAEARAFDSRGIVLAFESPGDTVADVTYERLDPPERARRRIRGIVDRLFARKTPGPRHQAAAFDAPALAVERETFRLCAAALSNSGDISELMEEMIETHQAQHGESLPEEEVSAVLWLYVDREGRVARAVVEQGTGAPWIDELLRPLGRAMKFEPATIDGAPYGVWTRQRLAFELGD